MATRTVTHITDDLDGVSDAETVKFGLRGVTYEIDLSDENQKKLEAALEPFLDKARKGGVPTVRRAGAPRAATATRGGPEAKTVRSWASENGIPVPARGRIPGSVIEQYQAAHA